MVVTKVGGVPDVVSESEALLVPAADPASLSRAIEETLADSAAAEARAIAAEQRLHRSFTPDTWVAEYQEIYYRAAHAHARAAR